MKDMETAVRDKRGRQSPKHHLPFLKLLERERERATCLNKSRKNSPLLSPRNKETGYTEILYNSNNNKL